MIADGGIERPGAWRHAEPSRRPATFEDLAACDAPDRLEIIGGEVVEKAAPSADHSWSKTRLVEAIGPFNRKPGGRGPGG
jgi:hypothetical protein